MNISGHHKQTTILLLITIIMVCSMLTLKSKGKDDEVPSYRFWISCPESPEILVVVKDLLGNQNYSKVQLIKNASVLTAMDPYKKLSPGVYEIIATSFNDIYKKKLLIISCPNVK